MLRAVVAVAGCLFVAVALGRALGRAGRGCTNDASRLHVARLLRGRGWCLLTSQRRQNSPFGGVQYFTLLHAAP